MVVTLYTTHCPKCKILLERLEKKNIAFETCEDMKVLVAKGFKTVPMLEVDGQMMDFMQANKWVSEV
jgi:glutaredoxin